MGTRQLKTLWTLTFCVTLGLIGCASTAGDEPMADDDGETAGAFAGDSVTVAGPRLFRGVVQFANQAGVRGGTPSATLNVDGIGVLIGKRFILTVPTALENVVGRDHKRALSNATRTDEVTAYLKQSAAMLKIAPGQQLEVNQRYDIEPTGDARKVKAYHVQKFTDRMPLVAIELDRDLEGFGLPLPQTWRTTSLAAVAAKPSARGRIAGYGTDADTFAALGVVFKTAGATIETLDFNHEFTLAPSVGTTFFQHDCGAPFYAPNGDGKNVVAGLSLGSLGRFRAIEEIDFGWAQIVANGSQTYVVKF